MKYIGGSLIFVGGTMLAAALFVALLIGAISYMDFARDVAERYGTLAGVLSLFLPGAAVLGAGALIAARTGLKDA